eukprot:3665140-Pyramimonas_sp.AAC.1
MGGPSCRPAPRAPPRPSCRRPWHRGPTAAPARGAAPRAALVRATTASCPRSPPRPRGQRHR